MFKNKNRKLKPIQIIITFNFFLWIGLLGIVHQTMAADPVLNFSDITSGPKTGNTDGFGDGAIVTIWGNNLGATQGTSKIYIGNTEITQIYYWKNADGQLPGGPADLYTYHKMQEIAFAIPNNASDGLNQITVIVNGKTSNGLPFTVRSGNIYFIKSTGNDNTGDGSWDNPWRTMSNVLSGNGKLIAGDIVYVMEGNIIGDINIGYTSNMQGTQENPYSVLVYPGTEFSISGSNIASFRNYNSLNYYWNFSKFNMETNYQAFSIFQGSRVIGNNISGPNVNSGYSGWIGGGCAGTVPNNCGGQKIYGNEVHDYGKNDGSVNQFQHLFYISNRSGIVAEGYDIAWNFLHDNPIYQGIHIYDQSDCGGWSGSINIYNNIIKNQGGNSININFNCINGNNTAINIFNNITVTDEDFNLSGRSAPGSALRIEVSSDTVVNVKNNTFVGWGNPNSVLNGITRFENNIFLGNRDVDYITGVPNIYDRNLFYNKVDSSVTVPSWSFLNEDPLLNDNFYPSGNSLVLNNGINEGGVYLDFFGTIRPQGSAYDIGAYEFVESSETEIRADVNQDKALCQQVWLLINNLGSTKPSSSFST